LWRETATAIHSNRDSCQTSATAPIARLSRSNASSPLLPPPLDATKSIPIPPPNRSIDTVHGTTNIGQTIIKFYHDAPSSHRRGGAPIPIPIKRPPIARFPFNSLTVRSRFEAKDFNSAVFSMWDYLFISLFHSFEHTILLWEEPVKNTLIPSSRHM
jgi:hypothetical protein